MSWPRLGWIVILVYTLSSSLNYLDRMVMAALAPELRREFTLSNSDYGLIVSALSLTYAAVSPLAGLFIDRVGLRGGIAVSVALWSLASMARGTVASFRGLLGWQAALGAAEAGGIPGAGKAVALYLRPEERALGAAMNQIGLSIGTVGAPLLVGWVSPLYGWRATFFITGILGFLWLPLWLLTMRRAAVLEGAARPDPPPVGAMLRDRRLWLLVSANILAMTVYSLWTNWTTLFLVQEHGLSQVDANRWFAWLPPLAASLGGLTGGWFAFRLMRAGWEVHAARMRVCQVGAVALLVTGVVPYMPGAALATAAICLSFFSITSVSVNVYMMPVDLFGAERSAFGVSALTFAYGLMQTVASWGFGTLIDRYGFAPVCALVALLPLAAVGLLRFTRPST